MYSPFHQLISEHFRKEISIITSILLIGFIFLQCIVLICKMYTKLFIFIFQFQYEMGVTLALAWEGAFCLSHPLTPINTDPSIFSEWVVLQSRDQKEIYQYLSPFRPLKPDFWQLCSSLKAERGIKNRGRKERKRTVQSHGYTVFVRLWRRKLQCESTHRCFESKSGMSWRLWPPLMVGLSNPKDSSDPSP